MIVQRLECLSVQILTVPRKPEPRSAFAGLSISIRKLADKVLRVPPLPPGLRKIRTDRPRRATNLAGTRIPFTARNTRKDSNSGRSARRGAIHRSTMLSDSQSLQEDVEEGMGRIGW
jgi:hypothetical protein